MHLQAVTARSCSSECGMGRDIVSTRINKNCSFPPTSTDGKNEFTCTERIDASERESTEPEERRKRHSDWELLRNEAETEKLKETVASNVKATLCFIKKKSTHRQKDLQNNKRQDNPNESHNAVLIWKHLLLTSFSFSKVRKCTTQNCPHLMKNDTIYFVAATVMP